MKSESISIHKTLPNVEELVGKTVDESSTWLSGNTLESEFSSLDSWSEKLGGSKPLRGSGLNGTIASDGSDESLIKLHYFSKEKELHGEEWNFPL